MTRKYRVTRTLTLDVELSDEDIADQKVLGNTDEDTVLFIADGIHPSRWDVLDDGVEAI